MNDGKGEQARDREPAVKPLDLTGLKQWIASLASDYAVAVAVAEHERKRGKKAARAAKANRAQLDALQHEFTGSAGAALTEDVLRRMLAAGVVQYAGAVRLPPTDVLPEQVVLDVAAFALWSVVQASALPADWHGVLARITSPRMAELVAQARSANAAEKPENFMVFVRVLACRPVSRGALNLLRDLGDPRGGGPALTALALAARLPQPDGQRGPKTAITWVFAAMLGGALGAEGGDAAAAVNRLVREAWDWMTDHGAASPAGATTMDMGTSRHPDAHGHSGLHGTALADELIHGFFH